MPGPLAYLPNIPQPTDQLSNSQGAILNNFGAIQTWIDQNHVDYTAVGNQPGKHNFVQIPAGGGTPGGGFLVGEDTFSGVNSLMSGKAEVLFTRGTGVIIGAIPQTFEMTTFGTGTYKFTIFDTLGSNLGPGIFSYVWTRFPSGILELRATQTNATVNIPDDGQVILYPATNTANATNPFPGFGVVYYVSAAYQDTRTNPAGDNNPVTVRYQAAYSTTAFTIGIANQWSSGNTRLTYNVWGI